MKAWHIQVANSTFQQLLFAKEESEAIQKSEASGWIPVTDIIVTRAQYADGLHIEPVGLVQTQLKNGWSLPCNGHCKNQVTIVDTYSIVDGYIYCENCSEKE